MNKLVIKAKKKRAILPEGRYTATVSSVEGKPVDDPKTVRLGFKVKDHEPEIFKEQPATINMGSPLLKDIETISGKGFTQAEVDAGLDLATLIGREVEIMVMHKSSAGGRPGEIVSLILPAKPAVALGQVPTAPAIPTAAPVPGTA